MQDISSDDKLRVDIVTSVDIMKAENESMADQSFNYTGNEARVEYYTQATAIEQKYN